jgi:hypothetical protein
MGQNGTLVPSSWLTASASAVLPVPGPPASSTARPDIFFCFTRSTTKPHAYKLVNNVFMESVFHQEYLSSSSLADETTTRTICASIWTLQTKAFDM